MSHITINNKNNCCGCNNCCNICPVKAISMKMDDEGFYYPYVDEEKCINCGSCEKVCPWSNKIKRDVYLNNPVCFAAKINDKAKQLLSSSGGMFYAFSSYVLNNGGVVVGSEMDTKHNVHHIIVENIDELYKIIGSKYVYSNLDNVFLTIKEYLNKEKIVLFSGVPCQVSALLTFLKKPYDNLITIEVVCHGTPSQKSFNKYVDFLEKKHKGKLVKYDFRSKRSAKWGTFKGMAFFSKDNNMNNIIFSKKINADLDPYYSSFLKCRNYRESCYICKFATPIRNADVTLGDFWGIERIKPSFFDYNGVSAVIINSEKGLKLFKSIKKNIFYIPVEFNDIQKKNSQLSEPSKRPIERNNWYNGIDDKDFIKKIKVDNRAKSYIKSIIPYQIKYIIKKHK